MITYSRPDAVVLLDELVALFAQVFAEPPYCETEDDATMFGKTLARQVDQPGFTLVIASDERTIVGFAYGHTQPSGWWWANVDTEAPPEIRNAQKFAVYEWAVAKSYREQGIGRTLLLELLNGRREPWATLVVNLAADAYRVYQRMGWRQIGISYFPGMPPMAAMIRNIESS